MDLCITVYVQFWLSLNVECVASVINNETKTESEKKLLSELTI